MIKSPSCCSQRIPLQAHRGRPDKIYKLGSLIFTGTNIQVLMEQVEEARYMAKLLDLLFGLPTRTRGKNPSVTFQRFRLHPPNLSTLSTKVGQALKTAGIWNTL